MAALKRASNNNGKAPAAYAALRKVASTGAIAAEQPLHQVLQLQQLAGNRAVGQTLRRSDGESLPASLGGRVEAMSGVSMAGVRVFRKSPEPMGVGAAAFAGGGEIHLAPGQEQHLPHEAWHIAQQRAGRVAATGRVGGTALNDSPSLEREATHMGQRAADRGPVPRPAISDAQNEDPDVIQRIVTQIVPDEEKKVIKSVLIIGRPENLYGASMGDHITAFIVQRNAVRARLINKTFGEALVGMDALVRGLAELPGLHMISQLGDEYLLRLKRAWRHMDEVRDTLPVTESKPPPKTTKEEKKPESPVKPGKEEISAPVETPKVPSKSSDDMKMEIVGGEKLDKPRDEGGSQTQSTIEAPKDWPTGLALNLQEYVNAYLEVRELVPFSAINVRAYSPALAGKGKGESSPGGLLALNESGEHPVPALDLQTAFKDLFDSLSITYMISQVGQTRESLAQEMSPGFTSKTPIEQRLKILAGQHVVAIHQAFPKALKSMGWTPAVASKTLVDGVLPIVKRYLLDQKKYVDEQIRHRKSEKMKEESEYALLRSKKTKKAERMKGGIDRLGETINKHTMDKMLMTTEIEGSFLEGIVPLEKMPTGKEPPPKKSKEEKKSAVETPEVEDEEDNESEDFAEAGPNAPTMATQVVLNEDAKISEVRFAGRTPSPFSGSMGAHTTSWVVHQDQIRRAVVGCDLPAAFVSLRDTVSKQSRSHEPKMTKLFPIDEAHKIKLQGSREALNKIEEGIKTGRHDASPYVLQEYIGQLLTYINFIPGATLEAANTGGKKEGKLHTLLVKYETGEDTTVTKTDLQAALEGLLDLAALDEQDDTSNLKKQKKALKKHHDELVADLYPTAWEKSGLGGKGSGGEKRDGDYLQGARKKHKLDPKAQEELKASPMPNFNAYGPFMQSSSLLGSPSFGQPFFGGFLPDTSPFGKFDGSAFKFEPDMFDYVSDRKKRKERRKPVRKKN